jgi:hypothetical protein
MLRTIATLAALSTAAPAPDARDDVANLLGCTLALAAADIAVARLVPLRTRDDSKPGVYDLNLVYDSAGAQILGMPTRGMVRSTYITARQTEHAFASFVDVPYEQARARLLKGYGQEKCYQGSERVGARRCLVHLRFDTGPEAFDVDVQVGERNNKVQFECLYGDLPH